MRSPSSPRPLALPGRLRSSLVLHGFGLLVFLAWRNLWRNKLRSLLTLGAMVVGLTLMIAYFALVEGLFRQMVGFATNISIGHLQIHRNEYIENQDLYAVLPWPLVKHLQRTTPFRFTPRLYAAGLASAGKFSSGALLKAIDPVLEPQVTDLHKRLRQGRFTLAGGRLVYPRGRDGEAVTVYPIVIGFNMAKNLQVELGGEIVLITQAADGSIGNGLFEVRGILGPIDPAFDRMGVLLSLEAFNSLMFLEEGVHELAVDTGDVAALPQARLQLADAVKAWPDIGTVNGDEGGAVRVRTWMEINPALDNMIQQSQALIYIVAVIVFVIAAMGILNTMLMATYERRHELGLLRALGMGRVMMMLMVLLEAFFLACSSALVGSATGVALAWYLEVEGLDYSRWLPEGLDFFGVVIDPVYRGYLLPEHVWISVLLMVVTAFFAALLPSWRTARLNAARVLHQ